MRKRVDDEAKWNEGAYLGISAIQRRFLNPDGGRDAFILGHLVLSLSQCSGVPQRFSSPLANT
ncbi:MAG: hypothetical protein ABI442_16850 [Gemmatimonadaceae bacterium]